MASRAGPVRNSSHGEIGLVFEFHRIRRRSSTRRGRLRRRCSLQAQFDLFLLTGRQGHRVRGALAEARFFHRYRVHSFMTNGKTKSPFCIRFRFSLCAPLFSSRTTEAPITGSPAEFRTMPSTVIASSCDGVGVCAAAGAPPNQPMKRPTKKKQGATIHSIFKGGLHQQKQFHSGDQIPFSTTAVALLFHAKLHSIPWHHCPQCFTALGRISHGLHLCTLPATPTQPVTAIRCHP